MTLSPAPSTPNPGAFPISLCMIVKNEAANLPRCLASAQPWVNEMIVVDTGSEDQTVAIATDWGATVIPFQWCDDFAKARNVAIAAAQQDWILVLDADEVLVVSDPPALQHALHTPSAPLLYLIQILDQHLDQAPLYLGRLFRNIPGICYHGAYHEQLHHQGTPIPPQHQQPLDALAFLHYGFAPELAQAKNLNRNIPLLEQLRSQAPLSLMLLTYLIWLYQKTDQPQKAQDCLSEAAERLLPHLLEGNPPHERSYIPNLLLMLGELALNQEDYETGRLICQRACEWYPTFPPLQYLTGVMLRTLGFHQGAIAYFQNCLNLGEQSQYLSGEPFTPAYMTYLPAHAMACSFLHIGKPELAELAFKSALQFNPTFVAAQEGLAHLQEIQNSESKLG